MAGDRMSLLETMSKAGAEGDTDFLRQGVQVLAEAVMEAEVTELTGVAHGQAKIGTKSDRADHHGRPGRGCDAWSYTYS